MIDGYVEDLSRSGMFLRAPNSIGAGTAAEIDLDVAGDEPLRLDAEVVRIERSGRQGMAFRFVDQMATKRTLANFIMRQHQSAQ